MTDVIKTLAELHTEVDCPSYSLAVLLHMSNVQMLEYEMATNADKLKSIVDQGKEMAAAGHFDSASILKAVQDFDRRLYLTHTHIHTTVLLLFWNMSRTIRVSRYQKA